MDAKKKLGKEIRRRRESFRLSQETLAERASITYQYLSALENGRENFSIGVLESLGAALRIPLPDLVKAAFEAEDSPLSTAPVINRAYLREVPLPPQITLGQVGDVLDETQRMVRLLNESLIQAGGRPLSSYIQANNFSGIVSNILTDSFDRLSPYRHNHHQRYPDLILQGKPDQMCGLEIKSTIQIGKGGESHNGHSGWHMIACFQIAQETGDIRFIHVMFADLNGHQHPDSDWKYVGSRVDTKSGSQRTETYNTTGFGTTKLRDGSAYLDPTAIDHSRWRPQHRGDVPGFSIFRQ